MDAVYVPMLVDDLRPFLEAFPAFAGLSVTLPHKVLLFCLFEEVCRELGRLIAPEFPGLLSAPGRPGLWTFAAPRTYFGTPYQVQKSPQCMPVHANLCRTDFLAHQDKRVANLAII